MGMFSKCNLLTLESDHQISFFVVSLNVFLNTRAISWLKLTQSLPRIKKLVMCVLGFGCNLCLEGKRN